MEIGTVGADAEVAVRCFGRADVLLQPQPSSGKISFSSASFNPMHNHAFQYVSVMRYRLGRGRPAVARRITW